MSSYIETNNLKHYQDLIGKARHNILLNMKYVYLKDIETIMERNSNRTSWFGFVKHPPMTFRIAFIMCLVNELYYSFSKSPREKFKIDNLKLTKINSLFKNVRNDDKVHLSYEDLYFLEHWSYKKFKSNENMKEFDTLYKEFEISY